MNDTDLAARVTTPGGADLVRTDAMPWGDSLVKHRQVGAMRHKRLFDGEEGSPDNYGLVLADESSSYYSPSHRHLWDQVRFCLDGAVPIGRGMSVRAGEVAYFPEGVRYGPQEGGPDRTVLVLQFGGASGHGYLSPEQIDRGRSELAELGRFDGGLFHRHVDGTKQDAYEAVWQHVVGGDVVYPEATIQAPIVLRPTAFPGRPTGAPGVRCRRLGMFEPRGLGIDVVELDDGATHRLTAEGATVLAWVVDGAGVVDGEPVSARTAIRLRDATAVDVRGTGELRLLVVTVPRH
jgi:hypothetical protein